MSGWKQETQSRSSNKKSGSQSRIFLCAASDKEIVLCQVWFKARGHVPFAADCIFIWITSYGPKECVDWNEFRANIICEKTIQIHRRRVAFRCKAVKFISLVYIDISLRVNAKNLSWGVAIKANGHFHAAWGWIPTHFWPKVTNLLEFNF